MEKANIKLYELIDITSPQHTLNEIKYVLKLIDPDFDYRRIEEVYSDIVRLFNGEYPGYRASNTKYHNLEHTYSVALALVRLIHGLAIEGTHFSPKVIELGIYAALFHDIGFIQTEDELEGTGAQYTVGHEARSIKFMTEYLTARGLPENDIDDCGHMIQCTILHLPITEIPFNSDKAMAMGQVMGTADLIAQIADPNYLDKLPLLFMEFEEAGVEDFESPMELFMKTEEFYHSVARKRLTNEMGGVEMAAQSHFRERWDVDRDLYGEAMQKNIEHAKQLETNYPDNYACLTKALRHKV